MEKESMQMRGKRVEEWARNRGVGLTRVEGWGKGEQK